MTQKVVKAMVGVLITHGHNQTCESGRVIRQLKPSKSGNVGL